MKIEENSDDVKYAITLQYIYANGNENNRGIIESVLDNVKNDTIKQKFIIFMLIFFYLQAGVKDFLPCAWLDIFAV